jgi:flavin-binding protein dodecin
MSIYRVTEVIGTSTKSWEDAAQQAVTAASRSLRDLRVAEVVEQDLTVTGDGAIESYRTKLRLSFKYEQAIGAPEWEGQVARAEA